MERKCAGASGSRAAAFSPHSSGGRLLSLRGFSSLETCPQLVPTHAQSQTEARSQPPLTGEYRLSALVARGVADAAATGDQIAPALPSSPRRATAQSLSAPAPEPSAYCAQYQQKQNSQTDCPG